MTIRREQTDASLLLCDVLSVKYYTWLCCVVNNRMHHYYVTFYLLNIAHDYATSTCTLCVKQLSTVPH